jgi:ribosomal protein S18 acetylase RimI-like enzyme
MAQITDFEIRPVSPADHPAVLALSPRLTIGAASWRGPDRIAAAARGWIEAALASAGQDGHAVLVAVLDGQVAGMISLAEREHFTGEVDAYISELAVGRGYEGRG